LGIAGTNPAFAARLRYADVKKNDNSFKEDNEMKKVFILLNIALVCLIITSITHSETRRSVPEDEREEVEKLIQEKKARMKQRELAIERASKELAPLMPYSIEELQMVIAIKVIQTYQDAKIISVERKPAYLGTISNEFDIDSIFNKYGQYGSRYGVDSIWNQYGSYGSDFSLHSPFNEFSIDAPIILKDGKVAGRLTVNKSVSGAVDPSWLRFYFTY
jgi:hypothetical protein